MLAENMKILEEGEELAEYPPSSSESQDDMPDNAYKPNKQQLIEPSVCDVHTHVAEHSGIDVTKHNKKPAQNEMQNKE